jgi:hypothetical protein
VPATCLSWASSTQSLPPHPTFWTSILTFSVRAFNSVFVPTVRSFSASAL